MSSVTAVARSFKQPWGGYIKPSSMLVTVLDRSEALYPDENISASLTGMAVEYLTRYKMGSSLSDTFSIALAGAEIAQIAGIKNAKKTAKTLLHGIAGLDEKSIINTCKLVTFDVWRRNPMSAMLSHGYDDINPNTATISNIKTMVERSISFWNQYGPITAEGFTFEPDGYTDTVDSGDGDFLTNDTLWDFKVSKSKPTSKYTLQLLMYWIMGQHSGKAEFKDITKLGIYNPRLNTVYTTNIADIPPETINAVETDVICY